MPLGKVFMTRSLRLAGICLLFSKLKMLYWHSCDICRSVFESVPDIQSKLQCFQKRKTVGYGLFRFGNLVMQVVKYRECVPRGQGLLGDAIYALRLANRNTRFKDQDSAVSTWWMVCDLMGNFVAVGPITSVICNIHFIESDTCCETKNVCGLGTGGEKRRINKVCYRAYYLYTHFHPRFTFKLARITNI